MLIVKINSKSNNVNYTNWTKYLHSDRKVLYGFCAKQLYEMCILLFYQTHEYQAEKSWAKVYNFLGFDYKKEYGWLKGKDLKRKQIFRAQFVVENNYPIISVFFSFRI